MNSKRPGQPTDGKPRAQRYEKHGNGRDPVSVGPTAQPRPERQPIALRRPARKRQAPSSRRRRSLVVVCFAAAAGIPIALIAVGLIGPDFLFLALAAIALLVMALGGLPDADAKDTRRTPVEGHERERRRPRSSPNLHNGGTSASPRATTVDLDNTGKRSSR